MTQQDTSKDHFTLIDERNGEKYEQPLLHGTQGPPAIDIRNFYGTSGVLTFDPGFTSTASCKSAITFIDGDQGVLLYRGYPIQELALQSDYMEVCYLLLYGELPSPEEKTEFENDIKRHTLLHDQLMHFFRGFTRSAHPMAIMVGVVGALSAFYHEDTDIYDPEQRMLAAYRIIAKMPTIGAYAYRYTIGRPFIYPRNEFSFAENLLYMTFSVPSEDYQADPVVVRALDRILILHADHEQNASTSTVRLAGSSGANPFACIAAGIASLWGPAHGGANEAVLKMLTEIGDEKRIPEFIARAKDKNDPFRLMGFGHRVYKNYDPRAEIMRQTCYEVLEALGHKDDPLLKLAMELERIALEDEYFIKRKLYPNVDFYTGIVLRAMGFPTRMFTVLFAIGRTVGWVAHWKEMISDPENKIGRPRQLYVGHPRRSYISLEDRPSPGRRTWARFWGGKGQEL